MMRLKGISFPRLKQEKNKSLADGAKEWSILDYQLVHRLICKCIRTVETPPQYPLSEPSILSRWPFLHAKKTLKRSPAT